MITNAEFDEMASLIENLKGLHEALPMLIFILKLSLHQARAQLQTADPAILMMAEVEVEAE